MADPNEVAYVRQILEANKSKTFVDRILNRDKYPVLDEQGNSIPRSSLQPGQHHKTHFMAWAQVGDKYVVHPTVLWDGKQLKEYSPQDAWNHAKTSGNYIEFDSPQEAEWFSENYKNVWGK